MPPQPTGKAGKIPRVLVFAGLAVLFQPCSEPFVLLQSKGKKVPSLKRIRPIFSRGPKIDTVKSVQIVRSPRSANGLSCP